MTTLTDVIAHSPPRNRMPLAATRRPSATVRAGACPTVGPWPRYRNEAPFLAILLLGYPGKTGGRYRLGDPSVPGKHSYAVVTQNQTHHAGEGDYVKYRGACTVV